MGRFRFIEHPGDRTHHRSEGFAGSRGHLNQTTAALEISLPGGLLKREWRPALVVKPLMDRVERVHKLS